MSDLHISVNTHKSSTPALEPIMPASIPVQIEQKHFRSINQARLYFRDILHKYVPGQQVNEDDREEVINLMMGSSFPYPIASTPNICVVKSRYGRTCFSSLGKDKVPHNVSIMHSLRECVKNTPHQPTKHTA